MIDIELTELPDDNEFAVVNAWYIKVGDMVSAGTELVELKIDEGNTYILKAPEAGVLSRIMSEVGEEVELGDILGGIKDEEEDLTEE